MPGGKNSGLKEKKKEEKNKFQIPGYACVILKRNVARGKLEEGKARPVRNKGGFLEPNIGLGRGK